MVRFDSKMSLFSLRRVCALSLIAALSAVLAAAPALAQINYGNFIGDTVDYLQVTEDANSAGDAPPLFGPPAVSGDSIDFDPVGFAASTTGGGVDVTEGQLKFTVMAHPFSVISTLTFAEAGDVTLVGFDDDTTFASVGTTIFIDVTEVDFQPINVASLNGLVIPFSPSGGTYGMGTDGGGGPLYSTPWEGSVLVDINSILTANGVPFEFGATKIDVNLDNTLTALSQVGTSATIAKKNANGIVITANAPIPEPSACLLAALGLAGVLVHRRRA